MSFRAVEALARTFSSWRFVETTVKGGSGPLFEVVSSSFCVGVATRVAELGWSTAADMLGEARKVSATTNEEECTMREGELVVKC